MPIFSLRVTENKHDELLVQKIVLFNFLVDNDHIYQVNQTLNAMRLDKKTLNAMRLDLIQQT